MTISTAFLDEIKKNNWVVHFVDSGKNFKVGETIDVVVTRNHSVSKVVVKTKKGDIKRQLVPVRGTLKTEVSDSNVMTIGFKFKNERGYLESFFLRFYFFKHDPTFFRYQSNPFDDGGEHKDCCDCCSLESEYVLYAMQDDGDKGGGSTALH